MEVIGDIIHIILMIHFAITPGLTTDTTIIILDIMEITTAVTMVTDPTATTY